MCCPPVSQCIYSYALQHEVEIQGSWWQPPCFKGWLKHSYTISPSDIVLQRSFLIICFSNCPSWPHNFLFYCPVLLGDKTCEELTKLEPENFRKPNRVTFKVKTSFTQYDFVLLLKWIVSGISSVSLAQNRHGCAPPTGTTENYRRKWKRKRKEKTRRRWCLAVKSGFREVSYLYSPLPGTTCVKTVKWRPWPQLNDSWPRVHGQVVVIIVQVVKDALLHQRLIDGFLENSFEVFPWLLFQVNFLIFYLMG